MNENTYALALIMLEVLFSIALLRTLHKSGLKISHALIIGGTFSIWLATLYLLISQKFFASTGIHQIAFSLAITIPVIIAYIVVQQWAPLKQAVSHLSTEQILRLQYWRSVFGVMFFFTSDLPLWFQYIGGLGDIAAGIGAFAAMRFYKQNPDKERQAIIRGNIMGMLDFVIVLSLGLFIVLRDNTPDFMFNLIPLFAVPLFLLLHVFSLQILKRKTQSI